MTNPLYDAWQTLIETDQLTSSEAESMFQTLLERDKKISDLETDAYAMYEGWRKGFDVATPMNEFRKHHLTLLYLDGSKNAFRCHCGCNVFFKGQDFEGVYYECNACSDKYREEKDKE